MCFVERESSVLIWSKIREILVGVQKYTKVLPYTSLRFEKRIIFSTRLKVLVERTLVHFEAPKQVLPM